MKTFELQFVYRPKPQPIMKEELAADTVDEAKAMAKERLDEMALKIAPPPDAVILVDVETRQLIDVIERS
jgi:hypothetical protein